MRERGLKRNRFRPISLLNIVAPHAGAWIETDSNKCNIGRLMSLPMRERGLKQDTLVGAVIGSAVAPHAGAWIETFDTT